MGQWLTPETATGVYLCRRVRFDSALAEIITGALLETTYTWRYEQFGALTPDETAALALSAIETMFDGGDTCMIGAIIAYATTNPPYGVLACDGAQYDRADYPALYTALDAAYIIDADTFAVPDLRGRTVIGTGQGGGLTNRAIDDSGGSETHTLTEAEMPSHTHTVTDPGVNIIQEGAPDLALSDPGLPTQTGSAGGDEAHNNMQPYRALHYGIVAK